MRIGDYPYEEPAPRGWICPKCGRVYGPSTPMCWFCGGEEVTNVITTDHTPPHLGPLTTGTQIPVTYTTTSNNTDWLKIHYNKDDGKIGTAFINSLLNL